MNTFEKQFEDLDVSSQYMEGSISASTTLTTPEDQVHELMQQVADEHNLELNEEMVRAPSSTAVGTSSRDEEELNERLARLRSMNA
jgi:charged multivesicular body protein 1